MQHINKAFQCLGNIISQLIGRNGNLRQVRDISYDASTKRTKTISHVKPTQEEAKIIVPTKKEVKEISEMAKETPFIQLPTKLKGIHSYHGSDLPDRDQWGLPRTINKIIELGKLANERGLVISVGDISLKYPGPFTRQGNSKIIEHQLHETGIDSDMRPQRKDHKNLPTTWRSPNFDREATCIMIDLIKEVGAKFCYFNDPEIYNKYSLVSPCRGHNNHIHVNWG